MKKLLCMLLFATYSILSFGQMQFWHLPNTKVDMLTYPYSISSSLTGYDDATPQLSTGVYDAGGATLYYIDRTSGLPSGNTPVIRNASGVAVGTFSAITSLNQASEIEMIPYYLNGSTCKIGYHIFYYSPEGASFLVNTLWHVKFDGTSISPPALIQTGFSSQSQGYAISKITPNYTRYVYYFNGETIGAGIDRTEFNNNILASSPVVSDANMPFPQDNGAVEIELSRNNDQIAYAQASSNRIGVIKLNGSNGNFLSSYSIPVGTGGGVNAGVQFDATGNFIYISHFNSSVPAENGIYYYDQGLSLLTGPIILPISTANYGKSQLELNLGGHIVAARNDGADMIFIDPSTNTIATTQSHVSAADNFSFNFRYIPDQVDGETYPLQPVGGYDLWISDAPTDLGEEPGLTNWSNIWDSPDLINANCSTCVVPLPIDGNISSSNYIRTTIRNVSCVPVASQPSNFKIYWTRGRSAEPWMSQWDDPSDYSPTDNTVRLSNPFNNGNLRSIPSIPYLGSFTDVYPVTYGELPIFVGNANFINDPSVLNLHFTSGYPMICFLARVVDPYDPMPNEQISPTASIAANVGNNNNIATRNTYGFVSDFIPGPNQIGQYVNIGINNNGYHKLIALHIKPMVQFANINFGEFINVYIQLNDLFWDSWIASGQKSRNISVEDAATHTIKITNPNQAASIQDVPLPFITQPMLISIEPKNNFKAIFGKHKTEFNIAYNQAVQSNQNLITYYTNLINNYPAYVNNDFPEAYNILNELQNATIYRDLSLKYSFEFFYDKLENDSDLVTAFTIYRTFRDNSKSKPKSMEINNDETSFNCTIYPNPTTEYINVLFDIQDDYFLTITDLTGRVVTNINIAEEYKAIDVNAYPAGIYIVTIRNSQGEVFTSKLIKN